MFPCICSYMFEEGAHGACILRQVLSRNQELTNSARMTGEPALGLVPPPPPQCWGCRHKPHHPTSTSPALGLQTQATFGFHWVLRMKLRISCFYSKHFADWAISQALDISNYLKMQELFLRGGSWQDQGGPDSDYKNEDY